MPRGLSWQASTTSFVATAIAFVTRFFACVVSRTAWWLRGPRTGWRGLKIHPIPGTGVPPSRRPRSKSHGMLAVELLEGVVGQHGRVDLLGDAQQEGVASSDRPGRRMDVLAPQCRLLEARAARTGRSGGRRWRRR